jgi:uroporphyrinogen-III synthase
LAEELPIDPGERIVLFRGDLADARLPRRLAGRGAAVREVVAYHTQEAPLSSIPLLRAALSGDPFDAVLLASGSAARGVVALGAAVGWDPRRLPAICLGPETAAEARHQGFRVLGEAPMQSADALAALTATLLDPADQGAPA